MSKQDIVAAALAAAEAKQNAVVVLSQDDFNAIVGDACDQSATEQKSSDGTLTQADLDAAVAAARAEDAAVLASTQAADAQALAQAQSDAQAAQTGLQSQIDALTAKLGADDAIIGNLKNSQASLKAALDQITALLGS